MNNLMKFIIENKNWLELLQGDPYNLIVKTDPDYPDVYLFKYNQYESDMNNVICQEARGIILEIEEGSCKLLCHSFDKFFNYGEPQGQQVLEKFSWDDYSFQEKRDGSLMRLWFYNNKWNVSTSGTIDAYKATIDIPSCHYSSFGDMFQKILDEKVRNTDDLSKLIPGYTYSFEMTSPENKIVVNYETDDLTFIGLRDNILNRELFPYTCNPFTRISCSRRFAFNSLDEAIKEINNFENFEGLVLCDGNYNRVKIKTEEYLVLARLVDETSSDRGILKLVLEDKIDDVLSSVPYLRERVDKIKHFLKYEVDNIRKTIDSVDYSLDKKTIALQLKGSRYSSFVFNKYKNSSYDFIRDYFTVDNLEKIYKRYKDFMSGSD